MQAEREDLGRPSASGWAWLFGGLAGLILEDQALDHLALLLAEAYQLCESDSFLFGNEEFLLVQSFQLINSTWFLGSLSMLSLFYMAVKLRSPDREPENPVSAIQSRPNPGASKG